MNHPHDQRTETRRPRPVDPGLVLHKAIGTVPAQALSGRHLATALEEAQREITTLKAGLHRRTIIGEAIGITMIQAGITADAAFARLVHLSQDTNVKVRDLAQRIVDEANKQAAGPRPG
jgi:ANTAR domain